ncbi:MAG: Lrp/AsnC family transcriptional regulator [Candidatus Micrarchaeia archaeon]
MKVDDLDIGILRELREHANLSYKEIAEKLKAHPNTVMLRIKRLEREGVIRRYSADIDYSKLGLKLRAAIMMKTRGVNVLNVGKNGQVSGILHIPQLIALYGTAGPSDAIAFVEVKDINELTEVIAKIQNTPGVIRTSTYVILATYKHSSEYNPFKKH